MISWQDYNVVDPDALETPTMLLFEDKMNHNIQSLGKLVGGTENLFAHVKTHKSEAVTKKEISYGIKAFKCATLKELEMVLQAGAEKAILSFPQGQQRKLERLCDLTAAHPDAWVATIASTTFHFDVLNTVATRRKQSINVMLDMDAGMHRTGIGFDAATKLYQKIHDHSFLVPSGFHVYDGHNDFSDVHKREAAAQENIKLLQDLRQQTEAAGIPVPYIVGGGGFSSTYYARTENMYGSPGTFVYWDTGFGAAMPDMPFRWAALVLTQVVDRYPDAGTITLDLGCKGISSDSPIEERALILGHESAKMYWQSEEHAMFRIAGELPEVGDYLLAVPGHVCPTTILYPGIHVINAAGEVVDFYVHTARDRT